jgi:hypothetical protein
MEAWKKGAVYGFLLIPLLFTLPIPLIPLIYFFALLRLKTLAGTLDALAMLPLVPMSIIHNKFEITSLSLLLTSMFI